MENTARPFAWFCIAMFTLTGAISLYGGDLWLPFFASIGGLFTIAFDFMMHLIQKPKPPKPIKPVWVEEPSFWTGTIYGGLTREQIENSPFARKLREVNNPHRPDTEKTESEIEADNQAFIESFGVKGK